MKLNSVRCIVLSGSSLCCFCGVRMLFCFAGDWRGRSWCRTCSRLFKTWLNSFALTFSPRSLERLKRNDNDFLFIQCNARRCCYLFFVNEDFPIKHFCRILQKKTTVHVNWRICNVLVLTITLSFQAKINTTLCSIKTGHHIIGETN